MGRLISNLPTRTVCRISADVTPHHHRTIFRSIALTLGRFFGHNPCGFIVALFEKLQKIIVPSSSGIKRVN